VTTNTAARDGTVRPAPAAGGGRGLVLAGAAYLVLGIGLWWGLWSTHPTATTTCGCGDAARFLWFFEWPAYALGHGQTVLHSTWLFHPGGINLLDDTSVVALGVVLAPVTRLWGPVASMNVALTLAPALSALAMFALLRRWVAWAPAAFFGGVAYGFSPFVVTELALNQLNIAFLPVPPLVVLVLTDLLVTQRRSPWRNGLALAGLVVVQFFCSTEVLVITVLASLVGVGLLAGWAAVVEADALRARVGNAVAGSAVAVGASVVVLAYPLWFLLAGPSHLTGPIWSAGATARYGTTWSSFLGTGGLASLRPAMLRFGGYQGPVLVGLGYLGVGVVVAGLGGVVLWPRDRRMRLFLAVGLVTALFSLGPGHGTWVPWDVLGHVPWVGDIVEVRFTLVVTLCLAVLAALAVDHAHRWLADRSPSGATAAGWGIVVLALLPGVVALAPDLPLTTRPVVLPTWYATRGATLPPGQVVLAYPVPFSGLQSSEAWQAVTTMRWAQAGGGGPQGQPSRAGAARPGFEVLSAASLPLGPAPDPTPTNAVDVRRALALWRVTTMVVPDQPGLPIYEQGRGAAYAVGFVTAVLGTAPTYGHAAWVWGAVRSAPAPEPVWGAAFARCTTGAVAAAADRAAVPACILAAGSRGA
jgi:branched-subunit amino acid transport protein